MCKRLQRFWLLLFGLMGSVVAQAQPDDLMIVGYFDAPSGSGSATASGYGIAIYNPTSTTINLSQYWFWQQNNGAASSNKSAQLSGTLAPGQVKIIGAAGYCTGCPSGCDINLPAATFSSGVNGDDALAISKGSGQNWVDMINLWNRDVAPRVAGQSNGLFENVLLRQAGNCTRYTSTAGSGPNSWPSASNVNVTGWTVSNANYGTNCLQRTSLFTSTFAPSRLPKDTTLCQGTPITLNTRLPATTPVTWNTGATGTTLVVTAPGRYIATINPGTCQFFDTTDVTIRQLPSTRVNDTTYCPGGNVLLRAAAGFTTYSWTRGATVIGTRDTLRLSQAGPVTLTVTQGTCTQTRTVNVTAVTVPATGLRNDTATCQEAPLILSVAAGFDTYRWNTGETDRIIVAPRFGTYSVIATRSGCQVFDTVRYTRASTAFDLLATNDTTLCNTDQLAVTLPAFITSSQWQDGVTTASRTFASAGRYILTAADANGCQYVDSLEVTIRDCSLFFPNVVTLNGDAKNETWRVENLRVFTGILAVYNRWGQKIYQVLPDANGQLDWTPGDDVSSGVYFVQLDGERLGGEQIKHRAWVQVLR